MHIKLKEPTKVNTQIEKIEHDKIMKIVMKTGYTKSSTLRMLIYEGLNVYVEKE